MLLTLFANQMSVLNTIAFLMLWLLQIGSQQVLGQSSPGSYLLETALANAGIGTILFLIWHLTFKRTQKQFEFSLSQNQEQFESALKQVNVQHKESLDQYKESMGLNQKTTDRMLELMRSEMEHKQLLAGILSEIKTSMKYHIENHKGKNNE
jgi:type VI protein secretion system component VasK